MDAQTLRKSFGIGLTGGVATGKSTVARMILKQGWLVFDADALSRQVMQKGTAEYQKLVAMFGADCVLSDGSLDRKRIRDIIFADADKKRELEHVVHRGIHLRLDQELTAAGLLDAPKPWFYEAALLFEAGRTEEFSSIWVTWCDEETQVRRLMVREKIDEKTALTYLANQMPARDKADRADLVIDTSGSLEDVADQVAKALAPLRPYA